MTPGSTLVLLQVLADRKLAPAAVRLHLTGQPEEQLAALAAVPGFAPLSAQVPCLIDAASLSAWPAELAQSLKALGVQALDAKLVQRFDYSPRPQPAAAVQWIDGAWYRAPPDRPPANQSASRALALRLLNLVLTDADTRDIEEVFRQDPMLSFHLLRLVNSVGMGLTRQISSFAQAIMMLGRSQLKRWLNLLLFANGRTDHRAPMLLVVAALRARLMELLARDSGLDHAGQELSFMCGMFSLLGALFGRPLDEVLGQLKLSDSLVGALLRHEGEIGRLLYLVETAEQGEPTALAGALSVLGLTPAVFNNAHVEACAWAYAVARDAHQGADHG